MCCYFISFHFASFVSYIYRQVNIIVAFSALALFVGRRYGHVTSVIGVTHAKESSARKTTFHKFLGACYAFLLSFMVSFPE